MAQQSMSLSSCHAWVDGLKASRCARAEDEIIPPPHSFELISSTPSQLLGRAILREHVCPQARELSALFWALTRRCGGVLTGAEDRELISRTLSASQPRAASRQSHSVHACLLANSQSCDFQTSSRLTRRVSPHLSGLASAALPPQADSRPPSQTSSSTPTSPKTRQHFLTPFFTITKLTSHPHSTEASLTDLFDSLLPRLHALVVGPGLGRSDSMQLAARVAIAQARKRGTHLVIDADGLFLVQNDPGCVKGYERCVLTPNVVEFGRLCKSVVSLRCPAAIVRRHANVVALQDLSPDDADPSTLAKRLSLALDGPTILQKGSSDTLSNGHSSLSNSVEGGLRRCGGQGDLLSGMTGVFLAWGQRWLDQGKDELPEGLTVELLAAYAAGTVTRETSRRTYGRLKRAMQASDMLNDVGGAFEAVFAEEGEVEEGAKL